MPEVIVNEKDVEWIKSAALPGVALKMLALDKETKAHAMLSRWDPGAVFPPHAHPLLEQQYTLEGECEYQGKVYGPGSHFIFPAGYEHGPFKTGDRGSAVSTCLGRFVRSGREGAGGQGISQKHWCSLI